MDNAPAVAIAVQSIPVDQLKPNPWNRTVFDPDDMKDLVASVKAVGIRVELQVRQLPDGTYQITSGHRRWLAAKEAGLKEVPCKVQPATDEQVAEDNITINIQTEDIPPLELARMVKGYIEQFNKTQQEAANKFGKSLDWVKGLVGFLNIPQDIRERCSALHLAWDQLSALKAAAPEVQSQVTQELSDGKLKPQDVAKRCKQLQPHKAGSHAPSHPSAPADPVVADPLADLWPEAKREIMAKGAAHWDVSYHATKIPHVNAWTFTVCSMLKEQEIKEFARWLYQLSQIVAKKAGVDATKSSMDEVIEQKVQMDAMMKDLATKYPPPAMPAAPGNTDAEREQRLQALQAKYGRIV